MEMRRRLQVAGYRLPVDLGVTRAACGKGSARQPATGNRQPIYLAILLLLGALPHTVTAQTPGTTRPWFVSVSHYGRWAALAGAGALLTKGAMRHSDADDAYDALIELCRATPSRCDKGPDGRYQDASTEASYQATREIDGQARIWIVAGEASLLAAGTMFLLDLVYHDTGPKNIPYTPFEVYAPAGRLGLTLRF